MNDPAPEFSDVYAGHRALVWRLLLRLGVARAEAPDAAQEVFLIVHRKLGDFDPALSMKAWLFGICRRVAADWRKRAHVRHEQPRAELPELAAPPAQVAAVEQSQARALLANLLNQMDDDRREVFVLYELEQWPMSYIAQAVACPVQTAYARLHSARKHLADEAAKLRRPWDAP